MNNLSDVVGGANLYNGYSYSYTHDRFCSANSAIYFNQGYLQVPSGVYFSGDFTVTVWIYLKSYQSYSNIFDFGNGAPSDNIRLSMNGNTSQLKLLVYRATYQSSLFTSSIINLNQWYFISIVLSGITGQIYVNGNNVSGTLIIPYNLQRTSNFIGKDNWGNIANAVYDELKFYNGALSSTNIIGLYQDSLNNGKN